MKNQVLKRFNLLVVMLLAVTIISCKDEDSLLLSDSNTPTDQEALEKIVAEDETLESFDLNYDEEEAMSFVLGKSAEEIYPLKIGQRMKIIERNLNIVFEGDIAYGTLEKTFEGTLFIVASTEPFGDNENEIDLDVYEKPFVTTITRNLIFEKVRNTEFPRLNWKITSISLPVGGTNLVNNISIENVTILLPNGETLIIESPLDYYLSRGPSLQTLIPEITRLEEVGLEVEIKSYHSEIDFVTLTHGALRGRKHLRAKKRLEYVEGSQREENGYFYRTFKGDWLVNQFIGPKHAVINAFPWGVVKDSETPVETSSWGIPYSVK